MNVLMPQLGETVTEGKITAWYKQVGDMVAPGDNLFEIETDKTSMEVPATIGGRLTEIRFMAGESQPVGTILALIAEEGATPGPASLGPPPPAQPPDPPGDGADTLDRAPALTAPAPGLRSIVLDPFNEVRTPLRNFGRATLASGVSVTPLARRLATEAGIDLSGVIGSSPRGRIKGRDVEALIADAASKRAAAPRPTGIMADQIRALYADRRFEEFAIDGMRSTIATRLVQSKQTIPHFYLTTDIELDRLLALRDEANAVADDGAGGAAALRISVNHLVVKAYALALRRVPAANAVWAGDRIFRMASVDVGIAVAIDGGLITPVIRDADTKPLLALSSEARDLAARARGRQLAPKQYQGGTGSVSNLGAYGVREFMAIINPPQSTILAVGAVQRRPVETLEGGLRFASQITVTLSCDHRVVDGAVGAELLSALKLLMESPLRLFL